MVRSEQLSARAALAASKHQRHHTDRLPLDTNNKGVSTLTQLGV